MIVNAADWPDAPVTLMESGARMALERTGAPIRELSVTLVADDEIRSLNGRYLGRDRPTDVLAFTLGDDDPMGDVYVGVDRARVQADDNGVPLHEELVRLAVHGALHVAGLDHPEGPERLESAMFALQERIVREVLDRG